MRTNTHLDSNQKVFLIACVGIVTTAVLGCMTHLVPTCVKLILTEGKTDD